MAQEGGLVAAIEGLDVGAPDRDQADQAELFAFAPALSPAQRVAELDRAGLSPHEVVRTARSGRPRGAKNRRTTEWTDYILRKYSSPLEFLAETYSRPVEMLAAELRCDNLEAYKIQCAAAGKLAEYVHQKQPVAVNLNGNTAGTLVIVQEAAQVAGAVGAAAMQIDGEFVEYQDVSEDDAENSDGENSDDGRCC